MNGYGKFYHPNNDVYEGHFIFGKINGQVSIINQYASYKFHGMFINDLKHGKCIEHYSNGETYEGN